MIQRGFAAVLFDCDGTLVDTERMMIGLLADWFAEAGYPLAQPAIVAMVVGISWEETYHAIGCHLRAHGLDLDDAAVAQDMHRRLEPCHFDPALVIPGSVAALRAAAALVPVAVVSGSSVAQVERHLANAGIRDLVTVIVGDGMTQAGKPDPAPYILAAQRLGVDFARCLAIEDSAVGIRAGVAAGMTVIALDQHHFVDARAAGASLVVDDLASLDMTDLLCDGCVA